MTTTTIERPHVSSNDRMLTADLHILAMPTGKQADEAAERELARRAVQRVGGEHAAELLDMLGLAPPASVEPDRTVHEKRCSTCRKWKPKGDFYPRASARDGLYSQCKACHNDSKARSVRKHPRDQRTAPGSDRNITWRITTPGGRGMACTREAVDERRNTYGEHIRAGLTPREAAEEMRIGMRTARRYHAELKVRGEL